MLLLKCVLTLSFVLQLVEASAVTRSLLHRAPRHLHAEQPVNIRSQVASALRCSTTSFEGGLVQKVGFRDEILENCNSSYCAPPKIVSFQRPCPPICNNGGTLKENGVDCDCPEGFYGLSCETRARCGRLMLAAEGSISLEIPFLAIDLKCVWEIRTVAPDTSRPGHRIILAAESFSIPPLEITEEDIVHGGIDCPENNRINVYQDRFAPGYTLRPGGYCGSSSFQTVISEGNVLYVELLLSVNFNMSSKFTFSYKTVPNVPHYLCHSSWTLNSFHGTLQTPGYPLNMPPRMKCEWTIIVRRGYTLQLNFKNIDLDKPYPGTEFCLLDFIIAVSDKGEFASLCGSQSNHTLQFHDPGRVYLLLYTDDVRQGNGFKVHFKHISQR